jgi:hypothetical protein
MNLELFASEGILFENQEMLTDIFNIYNYKHRIYLLNIEIEDHEQNINKSVNVL